MDLVPVYAEDAARSVASVEMSSSKNTNQGPAVQQFYGIKLATAQMDSGRDHLKVYARVEADESRIYRINFGTDGYVKETQGDSIGTHVAKNQHLAVVYSPEFLAVAGGYLAANEHTPGSPTTAKESYNASAASAQGTASASARADRLRNLGMSDVQIKEISQSRKLPEDVYVVSPVDGFVISRNINAGMRFERHDDLYRIADLHHIWVIAQVFGSDAQRIKPGSKASILLPGEHATIPAVVNSILPDVDPSSHAFKVRLDADNPGLKLHPGTFVDVELPISFPPGITVPSDAVLDSGLSKRVFVQSASQHFYPRTVETGWQFGDRIQIVKGLREGEVVVSSGAFLIDSEIRQLPSAKASLEPDAGTNMANRSNMN
jgi:RND family efflux transporter MFP subunit